jgi:hypothetical protein
VLGAAATSSKPDVYQHAEQFATATRMAPIYANSSTSP